MSIEVLLHACFGALGLLSGALALWARKGSLVHRRAGSVFFAVMMTTAASGAYLGFKTFEIGDAIAGIVTICLLTTSWMTVRRPEKQIGAFERGGFPFAAAAAVAAYWTAFAAVRSGTALQGGVPYMIIATIVAAAVGSFFPGRLSFFPQAVQDVRPIILLFIPFFAVIAEMIGWLIVVLFTRWYDGADGETSANPREAHS
jgi:uncharacterized membrane protein